MSNAALEGKGSACLIVLEITSRERRTEGERVRHVGVDWHLLIYSDIDKQMNK